MRLYSRYGGMSATTLQSTGLSFVQNPDRTLSVYALGGVWIDYCPKTEIWQVRGDTDINRGYVCLVNYVRRRYEVAQHRWFR